MRNTYFAAGALAVLAGAASAPAAVWTLEANMDAQQEVDPNPVSPATGFLQITLDDVTGQVNVITGSYSGLVANVSAAHIHGLAAPEVGAGVLIGLTTSGGTSGTLTGSGTLTPTNVTGMLNGLTYVNVHTSTYPGGEIRGQLTVVPEPTMLGLAGTGALVALRRRRSA